MIKAMLLAGAGGFVGTCGRYLIGRWMAVAFHGVFPLGTFIVNVLGCFVIGLCFGLIEKANLLSANEILLLVTGFCGGFTTFSTFANDIFTLGNRGEWLASILYLVASLVCGLLLVWLGRVLIR
ncbi:MAG: fluoride efflux transporter CrcB [Muribaculaceae bacterium]|nr:fluoride efflux transporter CrcB [Muribaculaceae bacterium]